MGSQPQLRTTGRAVSRTMAYRPSPCRTALEAVVRRCLIYCSGTPYPSRVPRPNDDTSVSSSRSSSTARRHLRRRGVDRGVKLLATLLVLVGVASCESTSTTKSRSTVRDDSARVSTTTSTSPRPRITVYAGYYDTHHPYLPQPKPSPWAGSPNVVFVGAPDEGTGGWDTSAVRIDNLSGRTLTVTVTVKIPTVTSKIGHKTFKLWGAQVVPATQSLLLAQTGYATFDGSDLNSSGCYDCEPELCTTEVSPTIPVINVTIGGTTFKYFDRAQVLNARGVDTAGCPYIGTRKPGRISTVDGDRRPQLSAQR